MRKSIKWLGALVSILILLAILTVVCLVTFVNPNRFKPLIAEQVMKHTGRQLTIEGDLSWSLFPYLGVKTGHILLSNPVGFEQKIFAEIQHATIGVKLFPLLRNQIESSGIVLDGLKLNLVRDANGKNNWQLQKPVVTTPVVAKDRSSGDELKKLSVGLMISSINVSDAEINWIDQQTKQVGSLEKLNLQAKNISFLKPFPISSEFDFTDKNPALSGHVKLTSEVSLSVDQQIFSFRDLVLTAQLQQRDKKMHWRLTGDVIIDLQQQTLQWTHFHGQMSDLNLIGNIGVVGLTVSPHATGHLQIQPFDLKALLQEMGHDMTNVQTLKEMSGDMDFTAAANIIDVKGKFKIGTIEAQKIKLSNIIIPMHYQIGILDLAPITANFYQGSLQSNIKINLTSTIPQIAIQSKLLNMHVESLLQDLNNSQKLKLIGRGNAELQVTTVGNNSDALIKNLNGTGHINVNQGVLQGVDIGYFIDSAYAILKQKVLTTTNTQQTLFDSLTSDIVFRDGTMMTNNLLLNSPRFQTKGQGTIDLIKQKIDFYLQTRIDPASNQKNDWNTFYGLPIPITITGNLKDPAIRLDTTALVKAIADQQIKKIESNVQDQIKDKVQEKAGKMLKNLLGN